MATMAANAMVEWALPGRPITPSGLDKPPGEGHRYELVDGVLVATPTPSGVDLAADTRVQLDVLLTAQDLHDGTYVEVGRAVGEDSLRLHRPFPVAVVPGLLLR